MQYFRPLFTWGSVLILASLLVQWFGTTYAFKLTGPGGSGGGYPGNGWLVTTLVSSVSLILLNLGLGVILIGVWHRVDEQRRQAR